MVNNEEITTKLNLTERRRSNIVRVDFSSSAPSRGKNRKTPTLKPPSRAATALMWLRDFDLQSPWVLRLLAVMFILILSMLIL